jgi:hypothetical protein
VKAGLKRRIQLKSKPEWHWNQKSPALRPLCFEIPNYLKLTSVAQDFQDKGYLVHKGITLLFLQHESSPWRRGNVPAQDEIHNIIMALQARGLNGQCIRTHPEDYNALPGTQVQPPAGPIPN